MNAIIIEGVAFIALLVVAATLVVFVVRHYTGVGRRLEQTRNRKEIERATNLVCVLHGAHDEREMVRLESGEVMCPDCYREALDGHA
jgi:hypothetical protein